MKSGLHIYPFFTLLKAMFLLVRLAFMVTLIGLWIRLDNNPPLACPSLQPLWDVENPDPKLVSCLMLKTALLESSRGSLTKNPHLDIKTESHQGGRKSSGDAATRSTNSRNNGSSQGQYSCCVTVHVFINIIFTSCADWYTSQFRI